MFAAIDAVLQQSPRWMQSVQVCLKLGEQVYLDPRANALRRGGLVLDMNDAVSWLTS